MLGFPKALYAAETGWLRQHPELALTLPEGVRPLDWAASCDAFVAYYTRLTKRDKTGKVVLMQRSRNPFDGHLSWFLSFDDPLDPIFQAITTLRLEAQALLTDLRLTGSSGPMHHCEYIGAVSVTVDSALLRKTWCRMDGHSITEFMASA